MNTTKLIAFVLVGVGIIVLAYQGITYTTRENVVDLGPIHVTAERSHTVPVLPVIGAIGLIGGIGLLFAGSRRS